MPSTGKIDGKVAPFSAEAFLAFCQSKPREERYDGGACNRCALAQFGFPGVASIEADALGIPMFVYAAVLESPQRFGALSDRLAQAPSS